MWRKWTDIKDMKDDENCEGDIVLFRYAELLLIYAEAKIEANQIDESVYKALDSIRVRAGMPIVPRGQTQAYMRSLVRRERKVELANEGRRLVRYPPLEDSRKSNERPALWPQPYNLAYLGANTR